MTSLNINYHNLDVKKINKFLDEDKDTVQKIKNIISNLPSLNIVKNKKLLNKLISQGNNFAKNKNNIIILGTGGSNLGSKALINILQGNEKKKIYFYDNIDPLNFKNSLEKIELENSSFIIISKSGSTPETLSQFGCLIEIFHQKNQLENFYQNCLIITQKIDSPLYQIAKKNNCEIIAHDSDIGGRYSVFSSVGIIPAVIAGVDVKKFYEGALNLLLEVEKNSFDEYLLTPKALTNQNILSRNRNTVLMTYSDSLIYFGKWFLQLWSESIGKNSKGVTPLHAIGTTDQHSQLQLYLDGPKDKFFTFVTTNHSGIGLKINNNIFNENEAFYLSGKYMGDLMQAEQQATIDTFKNNSFAFREIFIKEINEFSLGQLMIFKILETISACCFLNVDPFNQPAVEQGKIITKKYLS
tara:strand:+ start:2388 stop:3623 length:1236 start_codon:yes stop_codon:yes gene_type:complete